MNSFHDEGVDPPLELTWQVVVFQLDADSQRLHPTFDISLNPRVARRATNRAPLLHSGLAMNTGIALLTEIGPVVFLRIPGHAPLLQALPGFRLFAIGVIAGGVACIKEPEHA